MNFIKGDREVIAASEALSPVWRFWWLVLKSGTVRVEQNEMMSAVAKENKFSRFLDHGSVPPVMLDLLPYERLALAEWSGRKPISQVACRRVAHPN